MPFKDLREFIALLEEKKDLLRVKKPVDTEYEIAAYVRKTSDQRGPAVFLRTSRGSRCPWWVGFSEPRRGPSWLSVDRGMTRWNAN
jgi:UbiD family decarboxylase